ncbi:MAG TPA: hypothetical protein VNV43_09435 [Candidatus Acidoferrales bacterium]|jgi:hypothetical protein|nr:hypothetical protein [Candidatus Acidoferrales bacterium]
MLSILGQGLAGFRNNCQTLIAILIVIGSALIVFLGEFLIHLINASVQFANEQALRIAEEKRLHCEIKQALDTTRSAKAEKAVEKLTEFATVFFQRISAIKALEPEKYNPDNDDVLWNANAAQLWSVNRSHLRRTH